MKKIKLGKFFIFVGLVFWFAETCFFGWNFKPINQAERICDNISTVLMMVGLLIIGEVIYSYVVKKMREEDY